jgi:hypothetical protein
MIFVRDAIDASARVIAAGEVDDSAANRKLRLSTAAVVSLLVFAAASCTGPATPPPPAPPRLLLVGIDGAAPRVLDTMFATGRMKNLRSIAERGVYGPLQSETMLLSPRVWTTIATGKVPLKHGIDGWVKVGSDAKADLYYGSDRRGLALWNILSDAGKSVAVVNWLVTYPPEIVNGVVVTDHTLARDIEGKKHIGNIFAKARGAELQPIQNADTGIGAVYPPEWTARALAPIHKTQKLSSVASPFAPDAPDIGFATFRENLEDFWNADQQLTSIALEILDEKKPDVTMVLLQGIDRVSHFLFGCLETRVKYPESFHPTFEQRFNCQRAIYDYYEFTDQLIGRLLSRFGKDDLVVVLSDHGFEAHFDEYRTGGHVSEDASYGVLLAAGPRIRRGAKVVGTNIVDITPTVLDWYGMAAGSDMDGKVAGFLEPRDPPVQRIATYDVKPVERLGNAESGAEAKVKEDLRSLGYLQ